MMLRWSLLNHVGDMRGHYGLDRMCPRLLGGRMYTCAMRIGLDFGGVIADHIPTKIRLAREMFGLDVSRSSEVTRISLVPIIGEEKYRNLVWSVGACTPEFPLFAGVQEILTSLANAGHEFHVVTTQINAGEDVIRTYLDRYELPILGIDVISADTGKASACREARVEAFLDDSVSVLISLETCVPMLVWACFGETYEQEAPSAIRRVVSWSEFGNLFQ